MLRSYLEKTFYYKQRYKILPLYLKHWEETTMSFSIVCFQDFCQSVKNIIYVCKCNYTLLEKSFY